MTWSSTFNHFGDSDATNFYVPGREGKANQMILPFAVICGAIVGLIRSTYHRHIPMIPDIRFVWLVFVGFVLQYLFIFSPRFNSQVSLQFISIALVTSFLFLLAFAWFNRKEVGFGLLLAGVALNLLVIVANGGWMPISPETIDKLALPASYTEYMVSVGERFGSSKDMVLLQEETWFWWLSDIFVLPRSWVRWLPVGSAFSLGDILIGAGAIQFLWHSGRAISTEAQTESSLGIIG